MNKTQRLFLFLFGILIFMYDFTITLYQKLFFSGIILLLATSPKHWFSKPAALTPPITDEAFAVLRALLKLRSSEISRVYSTIRKYQNKAAEDDAEKWVTIFMKEYSIEPNDPWTEYSEKKKKKIKHRVMNKLI